MKKYTIKGYSVDLTNIAYVTPLFRLKKPVDRHMTCVQVPVYSEKRRVKSVEKFDF